MISGKEYDILFILLRAGLWEKAAEASALFPVSADCWSRVLDLARQQTVTGIAYRGLERLPDRFFPPEETMSRWTAEVDRIERRGRKMNGAVCSLFSFFRLQGLHPVLLKGQGVAAMYEYPLLREAGDIDVYFPDRAERTRAEKILYEKRIAAERLPDGSTEYVWDGVEVEHHPGLLDLNNPFLKRYLGMLETGKGYAVQLLGTANGMDVRVPAPALNLLQLNTHILKHAMGKGVGLRQLCDMARAYHTLHDDIDGNEIKEMYRRTGIGRWSRLLHSFLVNELGLPESDLPYREKNIPSTPLLRIILRGGNFGQYKDGDRKETSSMWRGKLHTFGAFLGNMRFSCRYAPEEAFWTMAILTKGQFKC